MSQTPELNPSKTQKALAWLDANPSANPHKAARLHDVTPTCIYAAIKRRDARKVCACCGQTIKGEKK